MKRDDEARTLWWGIYEVLSEGKPGLLGAVISRAEAQVMRLSCLFALLDCSLVVRKPHLEAALAVWRYSEDSARAGEHYFRKLKRTSIPIPEPVAEDLTARCFNGNCPAIVWFKQRQGYCPRCGVYQRIVE